ncbi:hypothetical protein BCR43DRAFT_527999 [Syncephalastrum racemosum]|uniref:Uncharacterized protein n=1 Tax=Syncephalastrum racemosum TaxID=13706 RepID=A0A1X2GZT7_SYNRA|nr:hypothetical protein BCR43DRAFT_527999 [Syncephalastrum racemosum]
MLSTTITTLQPASQWLDYQTILDRLLSANVGSKLAFGPFGMKGYINRTCNMVKLPGETGGDELRSSKRHVASPMSSSKRFPSRDCMCTSTMVRKNEARAVSGVRPIEVQKSSVRPDMLVVKNDIEFTVGECGKDDIGGVGKKETVEWQLHLPKIMKDMFIEL